MPRSRAGGRLTLALLLAALTLPPAQAQEGTADTITLEYAPPAPTAGEPVIVYVNLTRVSASAPRLALVPSQPQPPLPHADAATGIGIHAHAPRVGWNELHVTLPPTQPNPPAVEVTLGEGPTKRHAPTLDPERLAAGQWRARTLIPEPGAWNVTLRIPDTQGNARLWRASLAFDHPRDDADIYATHLADGTRILVSLESTSPTRFHVHQTTDGARYAPVERARATVAAWPLDTPRAHVLLVDAAHERAGAYAAPLSPAPGRWELWINLTLPDNRGARATTFTARVLPTNLSAPQGESSDGKSWQYRLEPPGRGTYLLQAHALEAGAHAQRTLEVFLGARARAYAVFPEGATHYAPGANQTVRFRILDAHGTPVPARHPLTVTLDDDATHAAHATDERTYAFTANLTPGLHVAHVASNATSLSGAVQPFTFYAGAPPPPTQSDAGANSAQGPDAPGGQDPAHLSAAEGSAIPWARTRVATVAAAVVALTVGLVVYAILRARRDR